MDDKDLELLIKECEINLLSAKLKNLATLCVSNIVLCIFWIFLFSGEVLPQYTGARLFFLSFFVIIEVILLIFDIIRVKVHYLKEVK